MEAAIMVTDKKTVVAESEQFKFYAKVGGLLNLKDCNTQKVKDLLPNLKNDAFLLVMATYRTVKGPDSYALFCSKMKGPVMTLPISPLTGFMPRFDGSSGDVLCGLRIHPNGDKTKNRQWTRFQGLSSKTSYPGFNELKAGYDYNNDYRQKSHAKYAGFYVTKNCSVVVYDIGSTDPNKEVDPQQNQTLVQEGGFVYVDADLLFKLADDSDDKLMTATELYDKFKDADQSVLGSDRYKKSHLIRDNKEPKHRSVIFFLNPSPHLLPYELLITDDPSKDKFFKGKRVAVLFVPMGAHFEYCEFWELADGIESVVKRQKAEPWKKYLQRATDPQKGLFEEKINDIPVQSYPVEGKLERSPQSEDFYKTICKARKGVSTGLKASGKKDPEKEKSDKEKSDKQKDKKEQKEQSDKVKEEKKSDKDKDEKSDKEKGEKSDKEKSDKQKDKKEESDKDKEVKKSDKEEQKSEKDKEEKSDKEKSDKEKEENKSDKDSSPEDKPKE